MRVIITGGTGYIGRHLVEALLERGDEAVVLSRSQGKVREAFGGRASAATWDGRTAEGWGQLADGADAIVNLAGESIFGGRWLPVKKKRIMESRTNAGRAVTEAVRQAEKKPSVVVQGAAVGCYGDRPPPPATEDAPLGEGFLADVCREWEASTSEVEDMGVRRAVARTGLVCSRDGGALAAMLSPFKLGLGGPIGDGKQGFPWIALEDEVGAILHLLDTPECHGPFNLTAPDVVDNRAFSKELARALRRPSFFRAPACVLRALLGEMAEEMLLQGQFVDSSKLRNSGYVFREPALRDFLERLFR
ncbi:TIGR01777 family oxidoreductase [Desulfohalovibrio reitneri]|uniref:TIGR01777 family oxidoreductase n=1 Tax=Desulfohalovibrio reitneri TaxID=1307759 RepID=UPI0004A6FDAB|nr:TIGR01777 family oxidoreductase [Desulfohalovibrio reitneri]